LSLLAQRARERGALQLYGSYEPTAKNPQTADFYPSRGFTPVTERRFVMEFLPDLTGILRDGSGEVSAHA
jgi:predicted enzyme involved in methoxymalonyl-ACP biosynthesis